MIWQTNGSRKRAEKLQAKSFSLIDVNNLYDTSNYLDT